MMVDVVRVFVDFWSLCIFVYWYVVGFFQQWQIDVVFCVVGCVWIVILVLGVVEIGSFFYDVEIVDVGFV